MTALLNRLLSYFPTNLPVGATEFDKWSDSIIELSGPYADRDSMKYAIATALIHASANVGALPKNYFVVRLRKSAANQVASQVFLDIKAKHDKQAAEATAAKLEADSGKLQQ